MTTARLDLTREQILAFRRRVGALDGRLPPGRRALRRAAWAGLQDSMPRAAILSIHARVDGTLPTSWEDPFFVQLWGPRFSVYVVPERDRAIFSLGRWPDDVGKQKKAVDLADRLEALLDGAPMTYGEAGRALGVHPNSLRYAAPTGRVLMRWEGARQPVIWMVPPPDVDPRDARLELARRYLHAFGPTTPAAFADWAGIDPRVAYVTFDALAKVLTPVRTPIGDAWLLERDVPSMLEPGGPPAPVRLLPSGDTYYLLRGDDRSLLVTDLDRRKALWTSRVWPGAILVDGEIVGTWRRSQEKVTIETWDRLSRADKDAVAEEAASLPLPDLEKEIVVRWAD